MTEAGGAGAFVTPGASMLKGGAVEAHELPFAVHDGCAVVPLVEASEMFPALERLVLGATRSVWLAFRIFDPDTRLRSTEARAEGLTDWGSLIAHAAGRGVTVRLLLTDFEPVMADHLHALSWASHRRLRALDIDFAERIQVIVAQHEGEIGWAWRQALRFPLRGKIRKLIDSLLADGGHESLRDRPGLWRHLGWKEVAAHSWKPGPPPRLWPATYHHKFAVIDGTTAIIGGLDINERRWDDARHIQRADRTWHDISSMVHGPVVHDMAVHYARLWNREAPRMRAIVGYWSATAPGPPILDPIEDASVETTPTPSEGVARVQLVRTVSRRDGSPFAFGPRARVRELRAAHHNLFKAARHKLYIEAQFFRSRDAARWLSQALKATPALEVIILVANAPEEVAFDKQGDNPAHRHGEWLQARGLGKVVRAGGIDRVGLFTLAKDAPTTRQEDEFEEDRGTAFRAGLIHIHAKLVIADDRSALLSSANINGRSFDWDTELGILWEEPAAVGVFRSGLWEALSDGALGEGSSLGDWRALAFANARAEPGNRRGFIVPYQLGRARRFSRPSWFVPDDLV